MNNFYIYISIMTIATLSIRLLPLLVFKKPIKNKFIQSFLYYVPYITLSAMTFPAIMTDASSPIVGLIIFLVAIVLAYKNINMIRLTLIGCLIALILSFII